MSIHQGCLDCIEKNIDDTNQLFIPVYLDSSGVVLDNSQNAVTSLDASYNFLMEAVQTQANYFRSMISYKKINDQYTFKYNDLNKTLMNDSLKYDIENTNINIYNGTFNSGHSPTSTKLAHVYIQYIADTLAGHPFSHAFISNESAIINKLNSSNIHSQFINAIINNLNTTTYNENSICNSILLQMKEIMSNRFENELDNVEYPLPFCPEDNITLFIKMKCDIELDNEVGNTHTTNKRYDILKSMFNNVDDVEFIDETQKMKLTEKVWRVRIKLL